MKKHLGSMLNLSENFWNNNQLSQLHIELTNACNAACPMCVRFYNNSPLVRPDLQIGQILLEQFKNYFPPKILNKCELILFCGVHGDPCVAKDFLEICEYIHEVSPKTIVRANTNGGMRDADWWHKVGKLFSKNQEWHIIFSIDGLADTNHIYRRNVDWDKLTVNVSSYISAGGTAKWDYLIFKHNEHQIEEAKQLSNKMGFNEFIPKKALGVDNGKQLQGMPALDKNGQLDYVIEAPEKPDNRNLELPDGVEPLRVYSFSSDYYKSLKKSKESGKDFQREVANVYTDRILHEDNSQYDYTEIQCKSETWKGGKEIFIDNFGRVMPCCYIGTHLNGVYTDTRTLQLHKHMNDYGWDKFDLNKHSLETILDEGHLDRVFADSWNKDTVEEGRLSYCADTCGRCSSIDKIFSHKINNKTLRHNSKWKTVK